MFARVPAMMRKLVRSREFVVSPQACEEMDGDHLSVYDIEQCLLSGKVISKQRKVSVAGFA